MQTIRQRPPAGDRLKPSAVLPSHTFIAMIPAFTDPRRKTPHDTTHELETTA